MPETGSREAYKSACLKELMALFACDESFRKSEEKLNRVLQGQEKRDLLQSRTLANFVEREGELIQVHVCQKAERILQDNGFNTDGLLTDREKAFESITEGNAMLAREIVCKTIEELNRGKEKEKQIELSELHEIFEDPSAVKANISLDDVYCKKQKAIGRKKGSPPKETREMVNNTVAHIQSGASKAYTLNTSNIVQMVIIVLAFLFHNGLMSLPGPLVFFIDGAQDLRGAIQNIFSFLSFKIVLDWYHLEKKCKERLSLAMNGKHVRNTALEELLAWLWLGKVDQAITYLRNLSKDTIKNQREIEHLIGYFSRNKDFIPCYALRKALGLRVSSNPVEKANDLVVSSRQKHNGMSWSASGSLGLATLTTLCRNCEQNNWLLQHDISFTFDPHANKAAA